MTKTELTQLTQIIEQLVKREIRKQLPSLIAETFQNMMQKPVINERKQAIQPQPQIQPQENEEETIDLKSSLREMFAGTPVMKPQTQQQATKHFTKNPVLNEILNNTPSLRAYERGAGAYTPAIAMMGDPMQMMNHNSMVGAGEMMSPSEEPSFSKNMPSMTPLKSAPVNLPIRSAPALTEGQTSTHAPLAAVPEGVSALDVARAVQLPDAVTKALTKNYSSTMKKVNQAVNARKGILQT